MMQLYRSSQIDAAAIDAAGVDLAGPVKTRYINSRAFSGQLRYSSSPRRVSAHARYTSDMGLNPVYLQEGHRVSRATKFWFLIFLSAPFSNIQDAAANHSELIHQLPWMKLLFHKMNICALRRPQ
ncbi:hypothetical protein UY3_09893 [Chelonia mydas]|uniref:Uncharacterized protein n=1 Tax=Chelonia mydas TaxID=8469 RepID=M7B769_CHEMY|nr:hypothetical protein UY3_09893 [Chelonia mydas]